MPLAASVVLAALLVQGGRDSLYYSVLVQPERGHLSVEARITVRSPGQLQLQVPPAVQGSGTRLAGFSATDDTGRPLAVRRAGNYIVIEPTSAAVRFRYRLDFPDRVAPSSTGAGLDTARLYAVTRALFVAPDPSAYAKTSSPYPVIRLNIIVPPGWTVESSWPLVRGALEPSGGDDLLGSVIAAGTGFRRYADSVGGSAWTLSIRGTRYFGDSALVAVISQSLRRASQVLGPVPVEAVSYTADMGRKGRVSGSLHGASSIGLVWEPSEILDIARSHDTFHETIHLWFGGAMESERWWIEGVTDYYAARLYSEWTGRPEDLAYLCYQSLRNYQRIPHRLRLTMAQEARQRMGGDNTDLLVYRKGMLAGLLLDAAIRRHTNGSRSLDDVARALLALAAQRPGRRVSEDDIRSAVVRAGGRALAQLWLRLVAGTEALGEDEVSAALQQVTGRQLPAPLAKSGKELMP